MPKKIAKKPTPGRPPKPPNSRKSRKILLALTPAEDAEIREAAAEAGLTLTDYLVNRALHDRRLAKILAEAKAD